MNQSHYLSPLVQPRAIVVFGAGDSEHSEARRLLRNLHDGGFGGGLAVVDAANTKAADLDCYPTLVQVPLKADLAVFTGAAEDAIPQLADCAANGIRAVMLAGGFARSDAAAREALTKAAQRHGLRVLGPNSMGILRPATGLAVTTAPTLARSGSIALISQSSSLCTAMLDWAHPNRVGFSLVAALGASVDVDFGDLLDFCLHDGRTDGIILHIERVRDARRFMSALRGAARVKPVLLIKAGRHADALEAGVPGGHDAVFNAAIGRCGVIRLDNVGQLFSAANALVAHFRPQGRRLSIITNGGGLARMAADRAHDLGIPLVANEDGTALLDLGGQAGADAFRTALARTLDADTVDGALVLFSPRGVGDPLAIAHAVNDCAKRSSKPVIACWMGGEHVLESRAYFAANSIPSLRTPEPAVELFGHLAHFYRNQKLVMEVPGPLSHLRPPDVSRAQTLIDTALSAGEPYLETTAVRDCLEAFHIRTGHAPGSRTLAIGVHQDAVFGAVISLGERRARTRGRAVALPPLNSVLARDLVKAVEALPGFEHAPFDGDERRALIDVLLRVSEMVCELPGLAALELNPLYVHRDQAVASSFELRIAHPRARAGGPYGHMAIHPYPARLAHNIVLDDGTQLHIRPIRPEDAALEIEFVRTLSTESKYFRFMNTVRELSPAMVVRLTQIDYDREMAFVAVRHDGEPEQQAGVSRYTLNPDGESCEFAIVVGDEWRQRGIARHLMQTLIDTARERGIKRMEGVFLARNERMLRFAARFGFVIRPDPDDAQVRLGVLELQN